MKSRMGGDNISSDITTSNAILSIVVKDPSLNELGRFNVEIDVNANNTLNDSLLNGILANNGFTPPDSYEYYYIYTYDELQAGETYTISANEVPAE